MSSIFPKVPLEFGEDEIVASIEKEASYIARTNGNAVSLALLCHQHK
jgi:hypothetical protein